MTNDKRLELLAPAKNADTGMEAILHGADAVYIGGPGFGAREDAANAMHEIKRLCDFAHLYRARVFMTLNTIVSDQELPQALEIANQARQAGVDALIVQDMGIAAAIDIKDMEIHASTQCDIRTPAKARFLESLGFSQIVLAREMNLDEIRASAQALESARIEYFIHGALCVSYSGQCYASFAATGRSANRGACAQLCRLPYSVFTLEGELLAKDRHVLSLKDNNQSENLAALIQAGVRSFKIEGRLKDIAYVKNVTAHYRVLLDRFIAEHPDFSRTSEGTSSIDFTPDLAKSFNRDYTDYFTLERHHDMAVFETPKNTGERIGKIVKVSPQGIELRTDKTLHNADGLTYLTREKTLAGFAVNRAEEIDSGRCLITTREPVHKKHPQLAPGTVLYRNRDQAFEDQLSKPTAKRQIGVSMHWSASDEGFTLTVSDNDSSRVSVQSCPDNLQQADNPERNRVGIEKNLKKTGGTPFIAETVVVDNAQYFAPAGIINAMRREALEKFVKARLATYRRKPRGVTLSTLAYPDAVDFRANVLNEKAVRFYANHRATITEPALEAGNMLGREIAVMHTKHCVRYALGLCLKDNIEKLKADPSLKAKLRPDPLILKTAADTYRAEFDCKKCEMTLFGRVRSKVSLGHPRLLPEITSKVETND